MGDRTARYIRRSFCILLLCFLGTHAMALPHRNGSMAEIEGRRIYYREWKAAGRARGRILLVHGFGASTFSWEKTAPALAAAGWYVVAADIPGFGYSEKIPGRNYRLNEMARLFWSLTDRLSHGEWILVGHSMGGNLVARMARMRPDMTKYLVEVDGALGALSEEGAGEAGILEWPLVKGLAAGILSIGARIAPILRPVLGFAYGRPASREEVAGYMAPLAGRGTFTTLIALSPQRMAEGSALEDFLAFAGAGGRGGREGRVLLVWGERDAVVPPGAGRELARLSGAPLESIPDAGHCPMETHPERFMEILTSALDRTD